MSGFVENKLSPTQLEDVATIEASGQFDHDWYYKENKDVANSKVDGIRHYVQHGASERRNPTPFFNTQAYVKLKGTEIPPGRNPFAYFILHGSRDDLFNRGLLTAFSVKTLQKAITRLERLAIYSDDDYVTLNRDIANAKVRPVDHALTYGFPEGRSVFSKATISRVLGRLARAPATHATSEAKMPPRALPSLVGVYFNGLGNGFIKEIAQDLCVSLTEAGIPAKLLDEESDIENRPPVCIFMAPHEFFQLGKGKQWKQDSIIRQSFMFNTEQPQTIWFDRGMPFMLMSLGVMDICDQLASLFSDANIPALHFNPEIVPTKHWLLPSDMEHPLVRVLPPAAKATPLPTTPFAQRPIDISFFGGTSPHREGFFTRNAGFLADYECFLYYRRFEGPHTNSKRDGILSRLGGHVTAHSKISLNIHRDDYGFFEWHRIVKLGMAGGSLVVSEPCLPHELYKPGVHFFEETGRHMPNLLDWLLKSKDGRAKAEEVRLNALNLIRDQAITARYHARLRAFIGNHSGMTNPA